MSAEGTWVGVSTQSSGPCRLASNHPLAVVNKTLAGGLAWVVRGRNLAKRKVVTRWERPAARHAVVRTARAWKRDSSGRLALVSHHITSRVMETKQDKERAVRSVKWPSSILQKDPLGASH